MHKQLTTIPASLILACTNSGSNRNASPDSSGKPFTKGRRDVDYASMAGFLRSRGMEEEDMFRVMIAVDGTLATPHGHDNLKRISQSIAKYAVKPTVATHDQFARYLSERLAGQVRYSEGYGWSVYEAGYWQHDPEGNQLLCLVRQIVAEVKAQVTAMKSSMDEKEHDKLVKAASKLENFAFMQSSMKLLQSDKTVSGKFSDFDTDETLLNLANGTLNLKTRILQPFNPNDLISYKLNIKFDPTALSPLFDQFLVDTLGTDGGNFITRLLGYAMLGHGREQKMFILQGTGKNGKSTLMELVTEIFGNLMVNVQPSTFSNRMDGQIRNDIARIAGKRLLVTSEMKAGMVLDAALMKQITGLDKITARFLRKENFEFQAKSVPLLVTNYLPVFDGSDSAMKRRICVIKFSKVIDQPDCHLPEKMKGELSGVLNRVLDGMAEYQAVGLSIPADIQEMTDAYVDNSNLLKCFYEDTFTRGELEDTIPARGMYSSYETWCKDNGYRPLSMNLFKDAFSRATGIEQERGNQGRHWPYLKRRGALTV